MQQNLWPFWESEVFSKSQNNQRIPRGPKARPGMWERIAREVPWTVSPRIYPGEQRPRTQLPGSWNPSCEPPPHAIPAPMKTSPGLQPAGWGWWGSAGQHTPPFSCPQSWDHWVPHHRRVACSLPRCLEVKGNGKSHRTPRRPNTTQRKPIAWPCYPLEEYYNIRNIFINNNYYFLFCHVPGIVL